MNLIGYQMTLGLFAMEKEDLMGEIEIGGAATYMEKALNPDIDLFI